MATIFKREGSPFWQISYFFGEKRITKSLGTVDRAMAVSEKTKLEGDLAKRTHEEYGKTSLEDVIEIYKKAKVERKATTNKDEFRFIDKFAVDITGRGKRTIDAITENDILSFMEQYREGSPYHFRNVLAAIKRLFAFAVKRKKIALLKNPAVDVEFRRIIKKAPTYFTDAEYLTIERAAEGQPIFPLIAMARYTGLRLAELRHIEWEDFDWQKREVAVKNKPQFNHTVKTYQERNVPFPSELCEKLKHYKKDMGLCFPSPHGGVYSIAGPRKALNNVLSCAGLKDLTISDGPRKGQGEGFHALRRTFASRLVQNGADIVLVSKWLGHKSIAVTEAHYAAFKPSYHADIELLNIPEAAYIADKIADRGNIIRVKRAVSA